MTFAEYRQYDALGLATLIREGQVSAEEVLAAARERTEAVNDRINAIIHPAFAEAENQLRSGLPEGPFKGVPFLIKDLGLHWAGQPQLSGSKGYAGYRAKTDSFLLRRYRDAGLVLMGKTNTPEFGLTPYTEPAHFGPTRNPWNLDRTAGGSSGGSAAAIAAGIVPLATASDGGGSIRVPASCCGLVGLKPSRGLLSLGPQTGEHWAGAVVEGCNSRTLRDTAAFLDVAAASEPGDPYPSPARPTSYLRLLDQKLAPLRIGFSTAHPLGHRLDEACIRAVQQTAQRLEELGHQVEEVPLPIDRTDLTELFITIVAGQAAATMREMGETMGFKPSPAHVEPSTFALYLLGRSLSAADYAYQRRRWNLLGRRLAAFHQNYDLLLTPSASQQPFPIGSLQPTPAEQRLIGLINSLRLGRLAAANIEKLAEKVFSYIPYTPLANMTGQPSLSLPLYWSEDGLPVGVLFTGPIGRDSQLLQLGAQLESAYPWKDRQPPL